MVELTSSAPKHKRKYVLACDPHATSTLVDIPTARCLICATCKIDYSLLHDTMDESSPLGGEKGDGWWVTLYSSG